MKFAYADPPYPGMAHFYPEKTEVDHAELVQRCEAFDGWALSTASTTLAQVVAVCPADVRIGAWCKPFASYKPGVNPAYAWEPVIFKGTRKRPRTDRTVKDWTTCNITLKRGLVGAKPDGFYLWLFDLLGYRHGTDEIVDLYPGTGGLARVIERESRGLFAHDPRRAGVGRAGG